MRSKIFTTNILGGVEVQSSCPHDTRVDALIHIRQDLADGALDELTDVALITIVRVGLNNDIQLEHETITNEEQLRELEREAGLETGYVEDE